MWCKKCNRETDEKICSICGSDTEDDIPYEVYWCEHCKVPLIKAVNGADKEYCPLCGGKTRYMATDLRPVFPEERLLLEILLAKPLAYMEKSVWASNNRYYIDGETITITTSLYKKYPIDYIIRHLEAYKPQNNYLLKILCRRLAMSQPLTPHLRHNAGVDDNRVVQLSIESLGTLASCPIGRMLRHLHW